jgi:hypothetical protein
MTATSISPHTNVRIHDKHSLATIAWDKLRHGPLARALIAPYLGRRSQDLIANTNHDVLLADVAGQAVPLVVNDGRDSECYLTSPYVNYIIYARDFARRVPQRRWRLPVRGLIALVAAFVRRQDIDRVVYINHWLVATGPRNAIPAPQLEVLTRLLLERFPDHALVVRGVREDCPAQLGTSTPDLRWRALFNRMVYVWPWDQATKSKSSREFRRDRRRLEAAGESVHVSATLDILQRTRLRKLYEQLYIDKYSRYNPQLSGLWFDAIAGSGSEYVDVHVIEVDGNINYFVVSFETGDEMIGSVVGHQPELSRQLGLYRAGVSLLMRRAAERRLPLNLSSGSGQFKLKRGAVPVAEHDWYCVSHLSWRARLSWQFVAFAYNRLARPLYQALHI